MQKIISDRRKAGLIFIERNVQLQAGSLLMSKTVGQWNLSPGGKISVAVSLALGTQVPVAQAQDALE